MWLVGLQLHLLNVITLSPRHIMSDTGYVINRTIVAEGNLQAGCNIH